MLTPNQDFAAQLQRWGQSAARLNDAPEEMLYALSTELNRMGLQIGLATACIRTPHPQLDMVVFRWRPLRTAEVPTNSSVAILGQATTKRVDGVQDIYRMMHGHTDEAMYRQSPFYRAIEEGETVRVPLISPPEEAPFAIVDDLIARGLTDYVVLPLGTGARSEVAVSLATHLDGGFPPEFLDALRAFVPVLSLSVAFQVERLQFREILRAYIGDEPAKLVLAGQIKRGDMVSRHAVLGFADLRGFTAASEELSAEQLLERIGLFFELVYRVVDEHSGEILKFIGDGVLFVFPEDGGAEATCDRGYDAVEQLTLAIIDHNRASPEAPLKFGCGLHFGEVLYGNIGSPARLDFTVLGQAVNLTSRLESLTGEVGEPWLVSERFATLTARPTRHLGEFPLKGLLKKQRVYVPTGRAEER